MVDYQNDTAEPVQQARGLMENVRRAREFYRYLQPDNLVQPTLRRRSSTFDGHHEHVPSLSAALTPFCQLAVMRCHATKAMLNVMDRDVMYFLAESSRTQRKEDDAIVYDFVEDPIFMSCSSAPLKGRICELTIRSDRPSGNQTPFFVVPDLTKSQFAEMAIVTGPPHYRFYAGVPITTRDDINIGSIAIMDTKPRPDGLTLPEEDFLSQIAQQIMIYLETNRQAIEGRQSRRMARGLEGFIAGKASIADEPEASRSPARPSRPSVAYGVPLSPTIDLHAAEGSVATKHSRDRQRNHSVGSMDSDVSTSEPSTDNGEQKEPTEGGREPRSHAKTFDRAANLLRESMGDLGDDGCVCFQSLKPRFGGHTDTAPSPMHTHAGASDPSRPRDDVNWTDGSEASATAMAKIIACSTSREPHGVTGSSKGGTLILGESRLRDLMRRYPHGHLWSLEDNSSSSSEEDAWDVTQPPTTAPPSRRRPSRRRFMEQHALRTAFPTARQVLFTPLWDATSGAYAHGVFVTTTLETRSFNATSDLSFLNAFCSTLMAECSRLDTMMADRQKSDFVGTISHEMRSPLHGVLASVEFLGETDVTGFQKSLIDTIDSCGRTLLDTINHVLDFSKVNSFQKQWQASNKRMAPDGRNRYLGPDNSSRSLSHGAPPLLQLFAVTNISAVLEEVVDGLVLGNTFTSGIDITDTSREVRDRGTRAVPNPVDAARVDPVDIVLDVEQADWAFLTQPGAVRRIIMNITGNAIKYTSHGHIRICLGLEERSTDGKLHHSMVLTVSDTGKGISPEFLATKLFVPFAQENALAPGTGLGMSIVRSIVLMLGGTIDVQSTVGKGTTVQVQVPLTRPWVGQVSSQTTPDSGSTAITTASSGSYNTETILLLRKQAAGATITFYRSVPREHDECAALIQKYATDWYHLQFVDARLVESVSVVVVEEHDLGHLIERAVGTPGRRPAIVVLCSVSSRHNAAVIQSLEDRLSSAVEFIARPMGPYKLARSIRTALEKKNELQPRFPQVVALGTIEEAEPSQPRLGSGAGTDAMQRGLSEMDLNAPGEAHAAMMVQATETFAASQQSRHAQMAIHDPRPRLQTPRASHTQANAFPFPAQDPVNPDPRPSGSLEPAAGVGEQPQTPLQPQAPSNPIDPHLLLVDDNKINLKLLETFLKNKRKYRRIAQAEDGRQAVDLVQASREPFDIIFMDISMPVMNGFEATRAIRRYEAEHDARPGAMVIALTGLASGRDQSEGFDSGCDLYMTKPVSFKEVGKLLDNWEEHQKINHASELADMTPRVEGTGAVQP